MTPPIDLANLRRDYRTRPLERSDLAADPVTQFQQWFTEALDANVLDPNAMAGATVGPDGLPSLRMVLLKHFDAHGFVFYTNHDRRKAREMAGNPRVALLLYWAEVSRQVRITGTATRVPAAESLRYFLSRPPPCCATRSAHWCAACAAGESSGSTAKPPRRPARWPPRSRTCTAGSPGTALPEP